MVPARNLLRRQYHSYGVCFDIDGDGGGGGGGFGNLRLSSDDDKTGSFMADDDSRSGGAAGGGGGGDDDDDGGWLRLGIGGDSTVQREGSSSTSLVELDLFSNRPSTTAGAAAAGPSMAAPPMTTVGYLGPPPLMPRGFSWGYVPMGQWDPTAFAGSSSSSYEPQRRFVRPTAAAAAAQQQPMWVVRQRVRAHVGIWFRLLASPNQSYEPYLPQINKSYLRIKDGRMTVRLLMKYLVNKLDLNNESEVEITCRGQRLHPLWTLQHVHENVWRPGGGDAIGSFSGSPAPSDHHVMILQYSRSS